MKEIRQSDDMPFSFPVVTVNGQDYTLRFTAGAGFRLLKRGIDPAKLNEIRQRYAEENRAGEFLFEILAAMLGREIEGKWKALGMTAEELADQLSIGDLGEMAQAITQSLKSQPVENPAEAPPADLPQVQ